MLNYTLVTGMFESVKRMRKVKEQKLSHEKYVHLAEYLSRYIQEIGTWPGQALYDEGLNDLFPKKVELLQSWAES